LYTADHDVNLTVVARSMSTVMLSVNKKNVLFSLRVYCGCSLKRAKSVLFYQRFPPFSRTAFYDVA